MCGVSISISLSVFTVFCMNGLPKLVQLVRVRTSIFLLFLIGVSAMSSQ